MKKISCKKIKDERGITLIALVITIVVLIILASVAINLTLGENGIFRRAKEAQNRYNEAEAYESMSLKLVEARMRAETSDIEGNTLYKIAKELENTEGVKSVESTAKVASIDSSLSNSIERIYVILNDFDFEFIVINNGEIESYYKIGKESNNQEETPSEVIIEAPTVSITMSKSASGVELKSIIEITDDNYEIDYTKCLYKYTSSATDIGTDLSNWNDGIAISNATTTVENMKSAGTYYLHVLATNEEGASKETISETPITITVSANLYVSANANASIADGTIDKPYRTLDDALDAAVAGNSIYIESGTYNLTGKSNYHGNGSGIWNFVGIKEKLENVTIFGNNEKTILSFDASSTSIRDGAIITTINNVDANNNIITAEFGSVNLRNLVCIYKPRNGENYQRAIFSFTAGNIENVFFRIIGSNSASYCYDNYAQSFNITNCTFYHDTGAILDDYTGSPIYNNIATNVSPTYAVANGATTTRQLNNIIVNNFNNATSSTSLATLISDSRNVAAFNNASAGVFYGTHAWQ